MNFTNLFSILESKNNLSDELFKKYLEYQNIYLEDGEMEDLFKLTQNLAREDESLDIFDGYYIGYKIPQISKEFDLLKITETSVINIELKSGANEEKIKEQLIRNKYYLDFLGKVKIYNITYQSNEDQFYILNEEKKLNKLDTKELIKILLLEAPLADDLNKLFDPSKFLVSPFNSTEKYIKGEYFLTNQQKEFKEKILKIIEENKYSSCAVSGKAGTGKTLLVYDIAKEILLTKKKVLIIHCGKLNRGHIKLRDQHNIEIIPIISFTESIIDKNYDLIIFDEAQRIYSKQLEVILKNKEKSNYLFSYDKSQTLSHRDGKYGKYIASELYEKVTNRFELSENIRTNEEVSSFIRRFINIKDNKSQRQYKNITIQYFENMNCISNYVRNLKDDGWVYISYTNKQYGNATYETYNTNCEYLLNAHDVIGQEFDNVVVIVGEKFLYQETGELTHHSGGPYMPHKMLFQAMTRVRKKLKIIIVNNPKILERCIEILNSPKN